MLGVPHLPNKFRPLGGLRYRLSRRWIGAVAQPRLAGVPPEQLPTHAVYVLENRALSDVVVLDLVCQEQNLPSPLLPIQLAAETFPELVEQRRFVSLLRPGKGLWQRRNPTGHSERLVRLLTETADEAVAKLALQPVAVYWGRAPQRDGSIWRQLISENWAMTSRLRRLLNLFVNRRDIVVHFGQPLSVAELREQPARANTASSDANGIASDAAVEEAKKHTNQLVVRRAARLLRVSLRNQRVVSMGPDFSHQRTLLRSIVSSNAVKIAVAKEAAAKPIRGNVRRAIRKLERRAQRNALAIMANFSYPTVRVLERLLRWFWNRIYAGVELKGLDRMNRVTEGYTLVYVPSHRSHVDYLLMSYLLFQHGRMIPHIAAGDNLNLPILGRVLRRAGAFFMRRSFKDDPIYGAVFTEYLYQVYRRGHCVEFFPEGGRSRTGRLLPVKLGLLKMTVEHQQRGIPRPIALVPVFFGYEKLIEASSYLSELQGSKKRKESVTSLLRSLKLIREEFGRVNVNIGEPILLDRWLATNKSLPAPVVAETRLDAVSDSTANAQAADAQRLARLGTTIMQGINASAALNPVSLVALVTLATPRTAIAVPELAAQIDCYLALLRADCAAHDFTLPELNGRACIDYVEKLQLLVVESHPFGQLVSHSQNNAVLMTWYRNNVLHTLAQPALLACLLLRRRNGLSATDLLDMSAAVFPFVAQELAIADQAGACERWLQHLVDAELIQTEAGRYHTPDVATAAYARLELLAQSLLPTLERMFIVVGLLTRHQDRQWDREELLAQSLTTARKMARIYGINAPEFFDTKLFDNFIQQLLQRNYLSAQDEQLTPLAPLFGIRRHAAGVIDSRFRQAVLRVS